MSAWTSGGTVVIQDDPARLDPHDLLDTVAREPGLVAADRGRRHLLTGGATLSANVTEELLELVPGLRIVDVLGSSETGRQGVHKSDRASGAATGTFGALADHRGAVRRPRGRAGAGVG